MLKRTIFRFENDRRLARMAEVSTEPYTQVLDHMAQMRLQREGHLPTENRGLNLQHRIHSAIEGAVMQTMRLPLAFRQRIACLPFLLVHSADEEIESHAALTRWVVGPLIRQYEWVKINPGLMFPGLANVGIEYGNACAVGHQSQGAVWERRMFAFVPTGSLYTSRFPEVSFKAVMNGWTTLGSWAVGVSLLFGMKCAISKNR